jgi:hypothetical protein
LVQHCEGEDDTTLRDLARRMLEAYAEYAALETTLPDTAHVILIEHSNRF